jgi:hypothetical protein
VKKYLVIMILFVCLQASSSSIADLLMPGSCPFDLIQGRFSRVATGRMGPGAADVAVRELGMDDAQGEGGRGRPGQDE